MIVDRRRKTRTSRVVPLLFLLVNFFLFIEGTQSYLHHQQKQFTISIGRRSWKNKAPRSVRRLEAALLFTSTITRLLPRSSQKGRLTSTSLSLISPGVTIDVAASAAAGSASITSESSTLTFLAQGLGYLVGVASLILYTPIAIRLVRQQTAKGLTMTTWWLKLASYSCSDIYAVPNNYPISTYVETLIITIEAMVILCLVAYYQRRTDDVTFILGLFGFALVVVAGLTVAPSELVAIGQGSAALLNVGALIPQFQLNAKTRTAGDYSPVTAGLAATGCLIRVFTTVQLAGSDSLLLASFSLAWVLNVSVLLQILYYGIIVEKRTLDEVLSSDWQTTRTIDDSDENGNFLSGTGSTSSVTGKTEMSEMDV